MTRSTSRQLLVGLLAAGFIAGAMVVGVYASSHTGETAQDTSYLRVAHASPDAPAVDVSIDNETVLTNASFGDVSDYLTLQAGDHTVTITAAGDPEDVVFEGNVTLDARTATTIAAAGEVGEDGDQPFGPLLYDDDALTPGENDSAVRVVHLSPDAPTVDVTAENGSVVLAENVSFGNASEYLRVPAGDYTVEIRADEPAADGEVVTTVNVSLDEGQAYSAMAIGYLDPEDAPADAPFEVALVEDATKTIRLPSEPAEEETPTETAEEETPTEEEETPTETATSTVTTTETPVVTTAGPATETEEGTATETETGTEVVTTTGSPTPTTTVTPPGPPG